MEQNDKENSWKDIYFPAAVSAIPKYNLKIDNTGRTKVDAKYRNGVLDIPFVQPCHCFLRSDSFDSLELNKVTQRSRMILPGIGIPLGEYKRLGQPYVWIGHSDIIDFKILKKRKDPRFVINTKSIYVIIAPFNHKTILQPDRNIELLKNAQFTYESMGIHSKTGSGYYSGYDEVFAEFLFNKYKMLYNVGKVKHNPKYKIPFCKKHMRTGQYYPEIGKYYCHKCKKYID